LIIAAAVIAGCQKGPLPTEAEKAQKLLATYKDPEQQEILEGILKQQRTTGSTLTGLAKDMARREAMEAVSAGPTPVQSDFGVARELLVSARRAVQSENWDDARGYLGRVQATIYALMAEVPAGQIRTHLERAASALSGSSIGIQADLASISVLAALDVALKNEDAPIVPDLARGLEKTKKTVDQGKYKTARKEIDEFIGTVSTHRTLVMLERAASGVRGAMDAMEREAGLVVIAELDQVSELFTKFAATLRAAPLTQPGPEPSTEKEKPEAVAETGTVSETGAGPAEETASPPAEGGPEAEATGPERTGRRR